MMIKAAQYSTHIPVLVKALRMTDGAVLEMGTGFFSTPLIHWMCVPCGRQVVSMESDPRFIDVAKQFVGPLHRVELVKSWDEAKIKDKWDVVLVDHDPAGRRRVDIPRLTECARLIVLHDTSPQQNHAFQYDSVWPLFKYIYHFHDIFPGTSLLSNFIDLDGLEIFS